MFSERGTESDMRIMLSATRLMQRPSLQMHISLSFFLSLSPTLQEHLNSVTPAKIAQPSKGSGSGTLGAIIGRSFRNFSVSVGRVVYETSENTLLDGRPISECGWKTCHVFSFRVVLEGVFICRFVICMKCNWHTIYSPFPQCCRVTFDPCSNVSSCMIQPNFLPLPFLHYWCWCLYSNSMRDKKSAKLKYF